jgi:hypothetical protein
MVSASQPRAAPSTVPIPPRTVEEPHFVDFDFDFGAGIPTPWPFELSHAVRQGRRGDAKYCADTRWEDKEWVVRGGGLQGGSGDGVVGSGGSDQQCHLVTLRFVRAQTEIIRLVGNISDSLYCGTEISSPLLATERRPAFPEVFSLEFLSPPASIRSALSVSAKALNAFARTLHACVGLAGDLVWTWALGTAQ